MDKMAGTDIPTNSTATQLILSVRSDLPTKQLVN